MPHTQEARTFDDDRALWHIQLTLYGTVATLGVSVFNLLLLWRTS